MSLLLYSSVLSNCQFYSSFFYQQLLSIHLQFIYGFLPGSPKQYIGSGQPTLSHQFLQESFNVTLFLELFMISVLPCSWLSVLQLFSKVCFCIKKKAYVLRKTDFGDWAYRLFESSLIHQGGPRNFRQVFQSHCFPNPFISTSLVSITILYNGREFRIVVTNIKGVHCHSLYCSSTQWTWVWVNSRSWWWTGRPGMLHSMGSQRVGHDWVTELN